MRKALRDFPYRDDISVRIHAYLLDPELDAAVPDMTEAEYLARTKKMPVEEVDSVLESLSDLVRSEGIEFAWNEVVVAPTSNAHRLICLARDIDMENDTTTGPDTREMRVHEGLQRARFEMGMNLAHPESLIALAQDFSIPGHRALAALENQEYASEVFSDFQIGVQMGVTAVPVFVFDQTFQISGALPPVAYTNALTTAWNHSHPSQPVSLTKDDSHE